MITIQILINGVPIKVISVYRAIDNGDDKTCIYKTLDDKQTIAHTPKDGCIPLAHKMLEMMPK